MFKSLIMNMGSVLPIKTVAGLLIDRFVGKFIDETRPLDLNQAKVDGDKIILSDLNINCKVMLI